MERRQFTREFKLEAMRLIKDRGLSYGKVRGEIQGSVNFFDLRTGWSGFVRAETRFGENLLAYGGKGGLRYQW